MAFGDIVQTAVNDGEDTAVNATLGSAPTIGNLIGAVAFCGDGALAVAGDLEEGIIHTDGGQDDGFALGYRVVESGDGQTWGFTQPSGDQFAVIVREFEG